jgi:hypothetical protein
MRNPSENPLRKSKRGGDGDGPWTFRGGTAPGPGTGDLPGVGVLFGLVLWRTDRFGLPALTGRRFNRT